MSLIDEALALLIEKEKGDAVEAYKKSDASRPTPENGSISNTLAILKHKINQKDFDYISRDELARLFNNGLSNIDRVKNGFLSIGNNHFKRTLIVVTKNENDELDII